MKGREVKLKKVSDVKALSPLVEILPAKKPLKKYQLNDVDRMNISIRIVSRMFNCGLITEEQRDETILKIINSGMALDALVQLKDDEFTTSTKEILENCSTVSEDMRIFASANDWVIEHSFKIGLVLLVLAFITLFAWGFIILHISDVVANSANPCELLQHNAW